MFKIDQEYFGTFSREAMKILKFMVEKWPQKKVFDADELGLVIRAKGRSLGGVLGSFSKRSSGLLIIKLGTVSIGWQGQKFNRPKQVWALNPKLNKEQIKSIENLLQDFLL